MRRLVLAAALLAFAACESGGDPINPGTDAVSGTYSLAQARRVDGSAEPFPIGRGTLTLRDGSWKEVAYNDSYTPALALADSGSYTLTSNATGIRFVSVAHGREQSGTVNGSTIVVPGWAVEYTWRRN